jgi:16S rRNA (cytosine1402-N4)-methyltransferase
MKSRMEFHRSVLLKESIDALSIKKGGTYVDATYGGGGHTREILSRLEGGKVIAFDQDEETEANRLEDPRLTLIHHNFKFIRNFLKIYKAVPVDGILADLGVSSHQINIPERGFSTRFDGTLDMRMDKRHKMMAGDVLQEYDEESLCRIFRDYGEVRNARKVARFVVERRKESPLRTTQELKEVLQPLSEKGRENKFFAKVFQALRIEINQEIDSLKEFLVQGTEVLRQGGRLVVISYHSLEDKLVKNYIRAGNFDGVINKDFYGNPLVPLRAVVTKAIVPGAAEVEQNNRARSAKMRVAEKC